MINSLIAWLGGEAKTVAFTILSGVIGFWRKFLRLVVCQGKGKLERLNQQLKLLYGPLYALNQATNLAWKAFRSRVRPGGSLFRAEPPPRPQELAQWRYWMLTVFRPIHEEMFSLVTKNADLLIEDDLPRICRPYARMLLPTKLCLSAGARMTFPSTFQWWIIPPRRWPST